MGILINPIFPLANGPKPASELTLFIEDWEKEATYVDILIRLDEAHKNYIDINQDMLEQYQLSPECNIVGYNKKGKQRFLDEKAKS